MLCGAPLASVERCSACGLAQEGGTSGREPFTGRVLVLFGALFVVVYAVTLFVVLLAR
jgi:hypothetical protein